MPLFILSYLAGLLTVLAPCVLPLLPIIVGTSLTGKNKFKPYFVIAGLVISITLFTLLLKASTALLAIDPIIWKILSGSILILFGIVYIFPQAWDFISLKLNLSGNSDKLLEKAGEKQGWLGDMLVGGSLGPVFASCSPTYAVIVATVLPVNFLIGTVYIIIYALGLATVMLAIALLGRKLVNKLNILADPKGWFKKSLGIVFILVGIAVITGFDKYIETSIIESGAIDWLLNIENDLLKN